MAEKTTFGAEPDGIDRLFAMGLEGTDSDEEASATASWKQLLEKPGGRIGRYKLLNVLAEGGMGVVYLAEQTQPIKRKVAVKVIKPGMDSARVIARFEAERQALALLYHPNIAHVYDAGTTEAGRPYFVMEYVEGLPITEHCDHHKLTIDERLKLFLQVCHAVYHAHQKGIIHRDIKPSNILVSTMDGHAVPQIIDFGVAKALSQPLTERTLITEHGQLFGTPEYMSPEQADMVSEDIDTRSDIYSLGVLLYVLLTGVLPFDSATLRESGIDNIRQIIRKVDPKTPSTRLTKLGEEAKKIAENRRTEIRTLAKHLHRELEWIPLKAMRKERSERYRSASELADDIENYLKGAPLIAGPPSTIYRMKKFVRRHKALVTGIAAVLAVLIAGVVVSTIFAIGQARARAEAERQARTSQAISDFLRNDLLASVNPAGGRGRDVTICSLLDMTSENLNGKFKDEPLIEASIRDTLGWTYRMLGELKAGEPHLERALQIRQEHLGATHLDTLDSVARLAWLRCGQDRNAEAAELLEKSLSTCRRVLGDEHVNMLDLVNVLGCVYKDLSRYDEAEQLYLKTIPVSRRVLGEKAEPTMFMVGNLGQTYECQGRYDEAERQFLETLRLRDGVWDDENMWTLVYKSFLAQVYRKQKRYNKAERLYLEILPIQQRVLTEEHPYTLWSIEGLARVYTHLNNYDMAKELFDKALVGMLLVRGKEHRGTIRCMNGLAELYTKQELYDKSKPLLEEALEISQRKLGDDHPWTLTSKNNLAVLYKKQDRYDEAEPLLLEAAEGRIQKLGLQHPDTKESIDNLIELYESSGKSEQADHWREKLAAIDNGK